MRLFLEVMSGPHQGKRIEAEPGRVVRVGRTTESEVPLDDSFMSGQHFAIEGDGQSFRLRDLNSRNGTRVNGEPVTEAELHDGDQVHAGRTDFIARIEDPLKTVQAEPPPAEAPAPLSPDSKPPEQVVPPVPEPSRKQPTTPEAEPALPPATSQKQTGIAEGTRSEKVPEVSWSPPVARVSESTPPPADVILPAALDSYEAATPEGRLLHILSNQPGSLMALVDATHDPKVLEVLRASTEEYQSLYLSEQNAAIAPYLVGLPPRSELLKQMIREGWGQNWGVYLTCPINLRQLREHLRQSLMVTMPDGMELFSRFYDPRFFRSFLETCTAPEAEKFFGPITSYFMEDERPEILLQFTRSRKGAEKKGHLLSVLG